MNTLESSLVEPSGSSALDIQKIRRKFEADGYFLARGVFSRQEIGELEEDFDAIVEHLQIKGEDINTSWSRPEMEELGAAQTTTIHTYNVQRYSARWHRAFFNEKLLVYLYAILGPDIILHHSKLLQHPPENGSSLPIHQDWSYFPTDVDTMIAGMIHVSDADDEMGCLRVYPGSHRLGRMEDTDGMSDSDSLADYPLYKATPVQAKAGDVVFFHYFTIHGSKPNVSQRVRKTVLGQFHAGYDAPENPTGHVNEKLVLAGRNHRMSRPEAARVKS